LRGWARIMRLAPRSGLTWVSAQRRIEFRGAAAAPMLGRPICHTAFNKRLARYPAGCAILTFCSRGHQEGVESRRPYALEASDTPASWSASISPTHSCWRLFSALRQDGGKDECFSTRSSRSPPRPRRDVPCGGRGDGASRVRPYVKRAGWTASAVCERAGLQQIPSCYWTATLIKLSFRQRNADHLANRTPASLWL
jgi:hypothetical protein